MWYLQAPQAFMTDNASAEKAALRTTWPEAIQLLCHFHVAQAEWRWLFAAVNQVGRDERRDLMSAFQKVGTTVVVKCRCLSMQCKVFVMAGEIPKLDAFLQALHQ